MIRVYKCMVKYSKGITMAMDCTVTCDNDTKIREMERDLKAAAADEFSTALKKFTAEDIKIQLIKG